MSKVLDGIEITEFNQLINRFIERDAPDAISFNALDEAARQQLDEVTATQVELTGTIRDGQITFDSPSNAPIIAHGNELIIGGLRLVVSIRQEAAS